MYNSQAELLRDKILELAMQIADQNVTVVTDGYGAAVHVNPSPVSNHTLAKLGVRVYNYRKFLESSHVE